MKKFKSLLVAMFCFLLAGGVFVGCGEQNIEAVFKQATNQIIMGETYDPYEFLDIKEEDKSKIRFVSGDESLAQITPDGKLVALKSGSLVLYVFAGEERLAHTFIVIEGEKIKFNTPVNLHYNSQTKSVCWNIVYADSLNGICVAPSYTVEITKNGAQSQTFETLTNSYAISENGDYKVRVKANGGGIFEASDYAKTETGEDKYLAFTLLNAPANLSYSDETNTLTWESAGNPDGTIYKVYINNQPLSEDGQTSLSAILPVSNIGDYEVYVEAIPAENELYPAVSESLTISRINAPVLSFYNGLLSWPNVENASGYVLTIDDNAPIELDIASAGADNVYDLKNVSAGAHAVSVLARGSADEMVFQTAPAIFEFEKLPTAIIKFNEQTKVFSVENSGENQTELKIINTQNNLIAQNSNGANSLTFNQVSNNVFAVSAQIKTSNPRAEIDGNIATTFNGENALITDYLYVKNLEKPEISYFEDSGNSYIKINNADISTFNFKINGEEIPFEKLSTPPAGLTELAHYFLLGATSEVFAIDDVYSLEITRSMTPVNQTYFYPAQNSINIQKLTAPESISISQYSLNTYNVVVNDFINGVMVKLTSISVNGENTAQFSVQNADEFEIAVQFIAQENPSQVLGTTTYFTSSDVSTFCLEKLPMPSGLDFDYSTKTLTWDENPNAFEFKVGINNGAMQSVEGNSYVLANEVACTLKVSAVANSFDEILAGETKFLNSNTATVAVYRAGNLTELHLNLEENGDISASWNEITGLAENQNAYFNVYLNNIKQNSEPIAQTNFLFDKTLFVETKSYEIRIEIVCPNNDYFLPDFMLKAKSVERLTAPTSVSFSSDKTYLTANGYNIDKVSALIFNGHAGENRIDISSILDGESFVFNLAFEAIFDDSLNKYYLNSNVSENFTIQKLSAVINVDFEKNFEQTDVFSWENPDDLYQGEFVYEFEVLNLKTNQTSQAQTTENLRAEIEIEEESVFKVRKLALNELNILNQGETIYLSSSQTSYEVETDNSVKNLKMQYSESKNVVLVWEYEPLERYSQNANFQASFEVYLDENLLVREISTTFFSAEKQKYVYEIDLTAFEEVKTYILNVNVLTNKTLMPQSVEISIIKLAPVEKIMSSGIFNSQTQERQIEVSLHDENNALISLTGVEKLIISGGASDEQTSQTFTLNPLTQSFIEVYKKALAPENITDGVYYLDSEKSKFNISTISTPTLSYNSAGGEISWEEKTGANSYRVYITMPSASVKEIITSETSLNLSEEISASEFKSGQYEITIIAMPEDDACISKAISSEDLTCVYFPSEVSSVLSLEKLNAPSAPTIHANADDLFQQTLTLMWANVENATSYEVYLFSQTGELNLLANVLASSGQTSSCGINADVTSEAKTYYFAVKAIAENYIYSDIGEKASAVRLSPSSQINLDENMRLIWSETTQTASNSLDFEYVVRILDNASNVRFTSSAGDITSNSFSLAENQFLLNLIGGEFTAEVIIKGNGLSENAGQIATLSSIATSQIAYKFYAPSIQVENNQIVLSVLNQQPENNASYVLYLNKAGETPIKYVVIGNKFDLPANYEAGEYELSAQIQINSGVKNYAPSNITEMLITKLEEAVNLTVNALLGGANAENPINITQPNIELSWNGPSQSGVYYNIYLNDEFLIEYIPEANQTQHTLTLENLIALPQTVSLKIQTLKADAIYSNFSNSVSITRLNAFANIAEVITNGASIDKNLILNLTAPAQTANFAGYYVEVFATDNSLLHSEIVSDITTGQIDLSGIEWFENASGADFSVSLTILGTGVGDENTTASLSSAKTKILGHKLATPTINLERDYVSFASSDEAIYGSAYHYVYAIKVGEEVISQGTFTAPIKIETTWISGVYTIEVYAEPNDGVINLITSNKGSLTPEKLAKVQGLSVEAVAYAGTSETDQKFVQYTFNSSPNAKYYDVYINDVLTHTIESDVSGIITSMPYQDFVGAGQYEAYVVARADGFISAEQSDSIKVIRLNKVSEMASTQELLVEWSTPAQFANHYTYRLEMLTIEEEVEIVKQTTDLLSTNSYAGFKDNTFLAGYEGGNFFIKIQVVGNGVADSQTKITTLSSAKYQITLLKLFAPEISPKSDHLEIYNQTSISTIPNGNLTTDSTFIEYSVKFGDSFVRDGDGNTLEKVAYDENNYLYYPNAWLSGNYVFTAKAKPNAGVANVIASNEIQKTATRLEAPSNLKFYRTSEINTNEYSSDEQTTPRYLSPTLNFAFTGADNAIGYELTNITLTHSFPETTLSAPIVGTLNEVIREGSGTRTINLISVASGDDFINSPKTSLSFEVLESVGRFVVNGGNASWNTVQNALNYIVKASDINDSVRYWQNSNAITGSYLNGILENLEPGQIAFNIKALGNIDILPAISTNQTPLISGDKIYLDSDYMATDSEFIKLEEVKTVVSLGFIGFGYPMHSEKFFARVYDSENNLVKSLELTNSSKNFDNILKGYPFVIDINELYSNLEIETLYYITIQAQSDKENIIYSDFNAPLYFKILENVNAVGDISLAYAEDMKLDRTKLVANASKNSFGLITRIKSTYVHTQTTTSRLSQTQVQATTVDFPDNSITEDYNFFIEVASVGGSSYEVENSIQYYHLTSLFTASNQIKVLPCPVIDIENGIIKWSVSKGADGYYVYINENLYGNGMFTQNQIELAEFGGLQNTNINVRIVAVSESLDYLYSPNATYVITIRAGDFVYEELADLIKLKTPEILTIQDGALIWKNTLNGLNSYSTTELERVFANHLTKQDIKSIQKYLMNLLGVPVNIYSQYDSITIPKIQLKFANVLTGETYVLNLDGAMFIHMSSAQKTALDKLAIDVASLVDSSIEDIENLSLSLEDKTYMIAYLQTIKRSFSSDNFKTIASLANNKNIGWPNIKNLFEEIAYNQENIPSGQYELSIRQIGNDVDWLNSNFTVAKGIYLPSAPMNFDIEIENGNFILHWDEVAIPGNYNYSPIDKTGDNKGDKYILYGEDKLGNRVEILRTNGTNGRNYLNLSQLVDENIITNDIRKIYMTVAGDNNKVLQGLQSEKLIISILPEIAPFMNEGVLTWNEVAGASEYSIFASAHGYTDLKILQEELTFEGYQLVVNALYNIQMRAVGQILTSSISGTLIKEYIISSKAVEFNLTKLPALDVEINKYGVFVWDAIENSRGFTIELANTSIKEIYVDGGETTQYISTHKGYHNYLFKALGSDGGIIYGSENVYYLNSNFNNNNLGLVGTILPSIENIEVADGVLKLKPLKNVSVIEKESLTQVIGYKFVIDGGIGEIYSTDLSVSEFYRDSDGNMCFDFTRFGAEGVYNLTVQPYIYFVNEAQTIFENAQTSYNLDNQIYNLLLGEVKRLEFEKSAKPHSVSVYNGEIVWVGKDGARYNVQVSTSETVILNEWTNQTSWWSASSLLTPDVNYYVKVKAFEDGKVYSENVDLYDSIAGEILKVRKLPPIETGISTYSLANGLTYISFEYPTGTLDNGFNLMYKPANESEFKYVKVGDANYSEVITYLNGTATILVNALGENIEQMQYAIQVVPLGITTYLCSSYSDIYDFSIPAKIETIYYDSENYEYYWQSKGALYSYVVSDEILNANGDVIALYRYKIKSSNISSEAYFKERTIKVNGIDRTIQTISYLPSVSGYAHRISVAVCLDTNANQTLMSLFVTAEEICQFNVLKTEKDIFASNSPIFQTISDSEIKEYMESNAVGSENNPYLVSSATDFENVNFRLVRYNYTSSYTLELFYTHADEEIHKTLNIQENSESAKTHIFKQTADLTLTNQAIGKILTTNSGAIIYEPFANTYDANGKTITYSFDMGSMTLVKSNFNVGLFYGIGANGVVKNLKLNASVSFAEKAGAIVNFGAITASNAGLIQNVEILSLQIEKLVSSSSIGVKTLTFGGAVGENLEGAQINLVTTPKISINISIANNGDAVYVGGIAGKNSGGTLYQVGNNIDFDVSGKSQTYLGGVVGYNTGVVREAYNKASLIASSTNSNSRTYIGGLTAFNSSKGSIINSYFAGALSTPVTTSSNGSQIYMGGLSGVTESANINNNFSVMASVSNTGALIAGTMFGAINVQIPSTTTNKNFYVNNSAYGGAQGTVPSGFVTKISQADLQGYAQILNNYAGELIFQAQTSYPIFAWEG